ncbi:MAG TPA: hypothetical protein VHA09_08350 [Nitrososphaera sp.]|nr:hypothetical protein [Nitrososphaera sp.]
MREDKIIIKGNSIYRKQGFRKEEHLEKLAIQNIDALFGKVISYVDSKKRIESLAGVTKVPDDMFLIGDTIQNATLWVVEYELADHPLEHHILPQITGFVTALKNERTRRQLRDRIYDIVKGDASVLKKLRAILDDPDPDIRYFLESVIENKLGIVIVKDERTDELDEIVARIEMVTDILVKVLEFERCGSDKDNELVLCDSLTETTAVAVLPRTKKIGSRNSISKSGTRVDGMTGAVKAVIKSYHGKVFDVKDVFDKIMRRKLVNMPASSDMDEVYHNYRAVIYHLKVDGKIRKLDPTGHSGEYQQVKQL